MSMIAQGQDAYSYDEVPYANDPYAQSHPAHLAAVARLFGLNTTPVPFARVLELGCASGGNVIPIAAAYPTCRCIGVELSERQLDQGRHVIAELGLTNIELIRADIAELGAELGEFDYIISHGVYSWVSPHVQVNMLNLCGRQLSSNGVAYISYNTLPGWHLRGIVRDLMRFHTRRFTTPSDRAGHARAMINFLAKTVPAANNPYGQMLRHEAELLNNQPDSYILHDHLEENNLPLYFFEFMERAETAGLQYVAESNLSAMRLEGFGWDVSNVVLQLARDVIEVEQYLDFLRNRPFRQTLLCRADAPINRDHDPETFQGLHLTSSFQTVSERALDSDEEMEFMAHGKKLRTHSPVLKCILHFLSLSWPKPVLFDDLSKQIEIVFGRGESVDSEGTRENTRQLGKDIWDCCTKNLVSVWANPPDILNALPAQPRVFGYARAQARQQEWVTNLLHGLVKPLELDRYVMLLCDGTRDQKALLAELVAMEERGELPLCANGQPIIDPAQIASILQSQLNDALGRILTNGLMVNSVPT